MTGDSCRSRRSLSTLLQEMFGARSAPIHFLKQCWFWIDDNLMNKLQSNIFQNSCIFIEKIKLEKVRLLFVPKWRRQYRVNDKSQQNMIQTWIIPENAISMFLCQNQCIIYLYNKTWFVCFQLQTDATIQFPDKHFAWLGFYYAEQSLEFKYASCSLFIGLAYHSTH